MEYVKVLRGQKALEVIDELLDNGFVLTPDYRLIHLPKNSVLIKKGAAMGPTQAHLIPGDWKQKYELIRRNKA